MEPAQRYFLSACNTYAPVEVPSLVDKEEVASLHFSGNSADLSHAVLVMVQVSPSALPEPSVPTCWYT